MASRYRTGSRAKRPTDQLASAEAYNKHLRRQVEQLEQERDQLKKEVDVNKLIHVGFTNAAQIDYAKKGDALFYPDTDNDCYIPLYMRKLHWHRTGAESDISCSLLAMDKELKSLRQERDQLAAKVAKYEELLEDWLPNEAFDSLVGSTKDHLAANNKALLLRLADEWQQDTDIYSEFSGRSIADWLRAKAEELG